MNKLERLKKLHNLIKLQEQDVLAEFKQTQLINMSLKNQIHDLSQYSESSSSRLMQKPVVMSEINIVRSFNTNVEVIIDQLNGKLNDNNKNLFMIAEKMKEVRSRIKSIERLADNERVQSEFEQQKKVQQQIDENINYQISTQKS